MNSDPGYKKIFWVLLFAGIIILSVLSWLSHSALTSVDKEKAHSTADSTTIITTDTSTVAALPLEVAKERASRFEYYSSILGKATPLLFIVLLIFANIIYVRQSGGFYLTLSVLFFGLFTMIDYLALSQEYFTFKNANNLWEGGNSSSGLIGIVLMIVAIIAVLFNHTIVKNWKKRQPLHASPDSRPAKTYDSSKLH